LYRPAQDILQLSLSELYCPYKYYLANPEAILSCKKTVLSFFAYPSLAKTSFSDLCHLSEGKYAITKTIFYIVGEA
jgi:hypothetical protein